MGRKLKQIIWHLDNNGCHICTSHIVGKWGYPKIYKNGKYHNLIKYIYYQSNSTIPKDKVVVHTCLNMACINPKHLSLGTHSDYNVLKQMKLDKEVETNGKKCIMCLRILPTTEFSKTKPRRALPNKFIYNSYCHKCGSMRDFGLTALDYDKMFEEQKGLCGICNKPNTAIKNFHIDHCHTTGKVRGLLCSKCNLGIGYFDDNNTYLQNAIKYLNKNQ